MLLKSTQKETPAIEIKTQRSNHLLITEPQDITNAVATLLFLFVAGILLFNYYTVEATLTVLYTKAKLNGVS